MIDKLSTVYKRIELLSLVRQTSMLTITLIDQEIVLKNISRYCGVHHMELDQCSSRHTLFFNTN